MGIHIYKQVIESQKLSIIFLHLYYLQGKRETVDAKKVIKHFQDALNLNLQVFELESHLNQERKLVVY